MPKNWEMGIKQKTFISDIVDIDANSPVLLTPI